MLTQKFPSAPQIQDIGPSDGPGFHQYFPTIADSGPSYPSDGSGFHQYHPQSLGAMLSMRGQNMAPMAPPVAPMASMAPQPSGGGMPKFASQFGGNFSGNFGGHYGGLAALLRAKYGLR